MLCQCWRKKRVKLDIFPKFRVRRATYFNPPSPITPTKMLGSLLCPSQIYPISVVSEPGGLGCEIGFPRKNHLTTIVFTGHLGGIGTCSPPPLSRERRCSQRRPRMSGWKMACIAAYSLVRQGWPILKWGILAFYRRPANVLKSICLEDPKPSERSNPCPNGALCCCFWLGCDIGNRFRFLDRDTCQPSSQ